MHGHFKEMEVTGAKGMVERDMGVMIESWVLGQARPSLARKGSEEATGGTGVLSSRLSEL